MPRCANPHCGAEVGPADAFCGICGTPQGATEAAEAPTSAWSQSPPAAPSPPPAATEPAPAETGQPWAAEDTFMAPPPPPPAAPPAEAHPPAEADRPWAAPEPPTAPPPPPIPSAYLPPEEAQPAEAPSPLTAPPTPPAAPPPPPVTSGGWPRGAGTTPAGGSRGGTGGATAGGWPRGGTSGTSSQSQAGDGASGAPATAPGTVPGLDALLGQAAPNTVYLGQRLQYEKERDLEQLDPLTSAAFWRELLVHAGLVYLIASVGVVAIFILSIIIFLLAGSAGLLLGGLLYFAWFVLMACVFWLRRISSQLSEWKFQIDDKGAAVATAFDHIAWSLRRRATPVDTLQLRRFQVPGQGPRDLLVMRQGIFYGLVSCFANGTDLYIGWTLWLYLSPAQFLWVGIKRLFWEFRFRGHAIYVSLQFDRPKAFREAIHSAVREGVDVAAGQATPQGQGTLGSVVQVVNDDSLGQAPWVAVAQAHTG